MLRENKADRKQGKQRSKGPIPRSGETGKQMNWFKTIQAKLYMFVS